MRFLFGQFYQTYLLVIPDDSRRESCKRGEMADEHGREFRTKLLRRNCNCAIVEIVDLFRGYKVVLTLFPDVL